MCLSFPYERRADLQDCRVENFSPLREGRSPEMLKTGGWRQGRLKGPEVGWGEMLWQENEAM